MLLQIPGVLNQEQVDTVLRELGQSAYEDGRVSAGMVARKCGPMILEALGRNGTFYSAALPHRVHGPMFNR